MGAIRRILIANRGEIACRIARTAQEANLPCVRIYTEADEGQPHADGEAYRVSSYLAEGEIIEVAKKSGADAVHPGYGFLAENPGFARAAEGAGIVFIGPTPGAMEALGDKSKARDAARELGILVAEGLGPFTGAGEIGAAARSLGPPLMLKAASGGGGKGMKRLLDLQNLDEEIAASQRETSAAFGDSRLIVERYVSPARHIEVQVFGDGKRAIALGERECSLQRRHQKLIEESPSTAVSAALRERLFDAACRLCESARYKNAGTVEFLLDEDGKFYFLEVNTRLQVEHPVTELCTGLDLVMLQIEVAQGGALPKQKDISARGHAIEARLNAEDPWKEFLPSSGKVLRLKWPDTKAAAKGSAKNIRVRVDSGIGEFVSAQYDPLLAKIIAHGPDRQSARKALVEFLRDLVLLGVATNQAFLVKLLESADFLSGRTFVTTVDDMKLGPRQLPGPLVLAAALALSGPTRRGPEPWRALSRWRLS